MIDPHDRVQGFDVAGAAIAPLTPYTAIRVICDPGVLVDVPRDLPGRIGTIRGLTLIGSAISVGLMLLIVASMYKSMVRGFDMTIRKQTASG